MTDGCLFFLQLGQIIRRPMAIRVYLSSFLLNRFEPNDERRVKWIDSVEADGIIYHYPSKYNSATYGEPLTEYLVILRLAEQYLIRAASRKLNRAIFWCVGRPQYN